MNEMERRFHRAMVEIYQTARRELGYNAARFIQMVSDEASGRAIDVLEGVVSEGDSRGFADSVACPLTSV